MGQEITGLKFEQSDFEEFQKRLDEETQKLGQWFKKKHIPVVGHCGVELEGCILDDDYNPLPMNTQLLDYCQDPRFVREISKFNFEINSRPHPMANGFLGGLAREMQDSWSLLSEKASKLGGRVVAIGILPTLKAEHFCLDNMSESHRYRALNDAIFERRNGRPFHIVIEGADETFVADRTDVMMESATTSFQIHYQVPVSHAVSHYNNSVLLSAPMVAVAANSPYFMGKCLWDETRIPLFEQSVSIEDAPVQHQSAGRVSLGQKFVKNSLFELFQENLGRHPVILPEHNLGDTNSLAHLKLHNGNIWRWNRPVLGPCPQSEHNLRIELRSISAGPSIVDMVANVAFYTGLMKALEVEGIDVQEHLAFKIAEKNFYQAARNGLRSRIYWIDRKIYPMDQLIENQLVGLAERGLEHLGVDREEARYYLREVLLERVRSGQNGAAWQKGFVQQRGACLHEMLRVYWERQQSGKPVHTWNL